MDFHTFNPYMLNLVFNGRVLCKFETFESGKAFDWITSKGYCIVKKECIPYRIWTLEKIGT